LNVIIEFKLENQILALTTDNATNMILAGYNLATSLKNRFSNTFFQHQRCIAHILNIAVQAGLKSEGNTIKKLRTFIKKIRKSNNYIEDLRRIHETMDTKFLQPVLDVK